jgi:hypothetical protein
MIVRLPGASLFRVLPVDGGRVLICRECGAGQTLTSAARALLLHATGCHTLAALRAAGEIKPVFVLCAGIVTEIFHEARARVA